MKEIQRKNKGNCVEESRIKNKKLKKKKKKLEN